MKDIVVDDTVIAHGVELRTLCRNHRKAEVISLADHARMLAACYEDSLLLVERVQAGTGFVIQGSWLGGWLYR